MTKYKAKINITASREIYCEAKDRCDANNKFLDMFPEIKEEFKDYFIESLRLDKQGIDECLS